MGPSDQTQQRNGTVCVTGASGFLASWLIKRLLDEDYHVRGAVRDPGNHEKVGHLWALPGATERLELVKGELLTEGSYDAAVAGCDGVFHAATAMDFIKSDPKTEMLDPAVLGTLNVLRSCVRAKVKRVVLTSSSAAVRYRGDLDQPGAKRNLDESVWSSIPFCTKYQLWYSLAKILAEQEAWKFAFLHSLDLVVVMPSYVVGPCLSTQLSKTAKDVVNLLNGSNTIYSYGRMGYVHVDDVARAHILVYETPSAEGRYNCSAQEFTPQELAHFLAARYPDLSISNQFHNVPPLGYYTLDTAKLRWLGLEFKPVDVMFDDVVASLEESGLLKRGLRNQDSCDPASAFQSTQALLLHNIEAAV